MVFIVKPDPGAICYIELACVVPLSGGETVYLKAGFGDLVSFIFSWLRAVVLGPTRWKIYTMLPRLTRS